MYYKSAQRMLLTMEPLTGISHDPKYEVWNACMFSVSEGVALVSQFGRVDVIEGEYAAHTAKTEV